MEYPAEIAWNTDAVYKSMQKQDKWSPEKIHHNIFKSPHAAKALVKATGFDPESIMLYAVLETWTTKGASLSLPMELSEKDSSSTLSSIPVGRRI